MIEDMVIPEVFYDSICCFLESKTISLTKEHSFSGFYKLRVQSKRTPIMEVVDNYFTDLMPENFSFTQLGSKYALAQIYQRNISALTEDEILNYRGKYVKLVKFLGNFK